MTSTQVQTCLFCEKPCADPRHLELHIRTHTQETPYKCSECSLAFKSLYNLERHFKSHHDLEQTTQKCRASSSTTNSKLVLKDHQLTHLKVQDVPGPAEVCNSTNVTPKHLQQRMNCNGSDRKQLACKFPNCNYRGFPSVLKKHERCHKAERPFGCTYKGCTFKAKWKTVITKHVRHLHSDMKLFGCSQCDYRGKSKGSLSSHIEHRHTPRNLKCDVPGCETKVVSQLMLYKHKEKVHVEKLHGCHHCDFRSKYQSELKRHLSHLHSSPEPGLPSKMFDGRKVACNFPNCNYRASATAVRIHARYHSAEKPFVCTYKACKFTTKWENVLTTHVRYVHSDLKLFGCQHCDYQAKSHRTLRRHIKRMHTAKTFNCDVPGCNIKVVSQLILNTHKQLVHGEKLHECRHCNFRTNYALRLKNHFRNKHANSEQEPESSSQVQRKNSIIQQNNQSCKGNNSSSRNSKLMRRDVGKQRPNEPSKSQDTEAAHCSHCGINYKCKSALLSHSIQHQTPVVVLKRLNVQL